MPKLTLNGTEYDMDTLGADAMAQVENLRFVESEIARLNAMLAVVETARATYVAALNAAIKRAQPQIAH